MQPSRDDFVIAIRSAFLSKSAQQRFSLLLLIFFSLILISLSKFNFKAIDYVRMSFKEIAYRSSFIVSIPEKYIKIGYYSFKDHLKLYKDYKNTKLELEILKSKELNNKYIIAENKRLKETIEEIKFSNEDVYAKVLLDKDSPFLKSFIINKGSKQKIKLGMAVLDKGYLVGKIIEVNFSTSRVLLLTDLNSKIPIITEPSGSHAILSGHGKNEPTLEYLPENHNVQNGDKIYTSGKEGIFNPGTPIGEAKVEKDLVTVSLFSNLDQITFVNIVLGEKQKKN